MGFNAAIVGKDATAGRLIYSNDIREYGNGFPKKRTSAPKQQNARAAKIPILGDHNAARITIHKRPIRVNGIAKASTKEGGYGDSK
jgi:hypothetical protein